MANKSKKTIEETLEGFQIYVAGLSTILSSSNLKPFGAEVEVIDVSKLANGDFCELMNQLDGLSYGDKSMSMPRWVQLDCGFLPSGFVGLALPVESCPEEIIAKFALPDNYRGLIPISAYCAIPARSGEWISHTCNTIIPGKGLGLLSKVIGLEIFGINSYVGVAQYNNNSVHTHTKLGDLELVTALTPAHSERETTFIYRQQVDHNMLRDVFEEEQKEKSFSFLLDPSRVDVLREMQEDIEKGSRYAITFPGQIREGTKTLIPIVRK